MNDNKSAFHSNVFILLGQDFHSASFASAVKSHTMVYLPVSFETSVTPIEQIVSIWEL
jgi:hypothetical protein